MVYLSMKAQWLKGNLVFASKSLISLFRQWWAWVGLVLDLLAIALIFNLSRGDPRPKSYLISLGFTLAAAALYRFSRDDFRTLRREKGIFFGHTFKVNSLEFSAHQTQLVSGSDRVAILWDPSNPDEEIGRLECDSWVGKAIFSFDDELIIGVGGKGRIFVWDHRNMQLVKTIEAHKDSAMGLDESQNGNLLFTGGKDGVLKIWILPDLKLMTEKEISKSEIRKVIYSPSDGKILAGNISGEVICYDRDTDNCTRIFRQSTNKPIRSIDFSRDGSLLAISDGGGYIHLIDYLKGEILDSKKGHKGMALACRFSPDYEYLASSGQDRKIVLWKVYKRRLTRWFYIEGHDDPVISLAFLKDKNHLFSGSRDSTIRSWDLSGLV